LLGITVKTSERVTGIFQQRYGKPCEAVARAPGRVNLLGEHVDYNDGFVMPAATDRATYVAFASSGSDETTLWAEDFQEEARFTSTSLHDKRGADGEPLAGWARYPAGVAWSLMQAGHPARGMLAAFASDVPRGAGLSSSASVEVAFGMAWMKLAGVALPPMDLALICQRAENQYVGVNCGIMDQAASACSEEGRLMLLDCRSLEYQTLPLAEGTVIIVADTGVRHNLASSAYNDRRAACEKAVEMLRRDVPGIKALRDVSLEDFDRFAHKLPPEVEMRARHVVEEIERARRAPVHLQSGDLQAFGRSMNACHASLRDLYEVSCPELDAMAAIAQSLPGCYGARLTGAGFGGCTVNLVDRARADAFVDALRTGYQSATPREAEIYVCTASRGAEILT
jgi:galactokinase